MRETGARARERERWQDYTQDKYDISYTVEMRTAGIQGGF